MKAKRASRAILYVVLTIIALYTLSPLAFLLINSFKTQPEIVSAPLALPSSWDFGHLTGAAEQINFWKALAITALVTLTSVALLVVVSSLSAWMMVRNHTRFSNVLLLMFTAAMLVPFQAVMYPLISLMENLQLKNLLVLIIMYAHGFCPEGSNRVMQHFVIFLKEIRPCSDRFIQKLHVYEKLCLLRKLFCPLKIPFVETAQKKSQILVDLFSCRPLRRRL